MSSQIELLKSLFTLEQEQLHEYLIDILLDHYGENNVIEDYGQFLFAKGDIDVLLVAHLDTVHKIKPTLDEIFYDQDKGIMWSPRGIGGDDRCGVYIILSILFAGYKPHIAFTWNEEIGCVGSRNMVNVFNPKEQMSTNINFAIQFDRRGHKEAVYYDLDSPEFEQYITSFGFDTKLGSFTDICEICPDWGFAGVNLSAGYANEHTTNEMVFIATINDTLHKAIAILKEQSTEPTFFPYKETPKRPFMHQYHKDQGYRWWNDEDEYEYPHWKEWAQKKEEEKKELNDTSFCSTCNQQKPWYEFSEDNHLQDTCILCYNKYIENDYNTYDYYEDSFIDDDDDGNDLVLTPNYNREKGVY